MELFGLGGVSMLLLDFQDFYQSLCFMCSCSRWGPYYHYQGGHTSFIDGNPPRFISLPSIHGGEILKRVFFIGFLGHCFNCGAEKDTVLLGVLGVGYLQVRGSRQQIRRGRLVRSLFATLAGVREQMHRLPGTMGRSHPAALGEHVKKVDVRRSIRIQSKK